MPSLLFVVRHVAEAIGWRYDAMMVMVKKEVEHLQMEDLCKLEENPRSILLHITVKENPDEEVALDALMARGSDSYRVVSENELNEIR
ncbi:hypothetical protein ACLOJK_007373 [Asimina triloba]